jgi:peptidoglycan/xylan/chitin deacetylase (PgdA/CDA1 family)
MPRKVTLTFDNGPTPEVTPYVLDSLAKNDAKATFFVIGRKAASPEGIPLVQRARKEGHYIGNHTFTHTTPLGELGRAAALREFEQTEKALSWLDQPRRLFRPYARAGTLGRHLLHPAVMERLLTGGYWCVLWNSVPGDWRDPEGWVERAIADSRSRPWSLVVLHDLPSGAMMHLDRFLRALKDDGVELTQEYPPECVPIADGKIMQPLDQFVADELP